jgi:hypothetical protein
MAATGYPPVLCSRAPWARGAASRSRSICRELDRLAARMPKEQRRAALLADLAALDAEPARPDEAEDTPAP